MFGRHPRIPVDLVLGQTKENTTTTTSGYVTQLKERLAKAFEVAEANTSDSRTGQKEQYDKKVRGAFLAEGDRVLIKCVGFKDTHKIADRWSNDVYKVVRQPSQDIPVFEVKPETGPGRVKVLHRNLLLPLPKNQENPENMTAEQAQSQESDESEDEDAVIVNVKHKTQSPQRIPGPMDSEHDNSPESSIPEDNSTLGSVRQNLDAIGAYTDENFTTDQEEIDLETSHHTEEINPSSGSEPSVNLEIQNPTVTDSEISEEHQSSISMESEQVSEENQSSSMEVEQASEQLSVDTDTDSEEQVQTIQKEHIL